MRRRSGRVLDPACGRGALPCGRWLLALLTHDHGGSTVRSATTEERLDASSLLEDFYAPPVLLPVEEDALPFCSVSRHFTALGATFIVRSTESLLSAYLDVLL